MKILAIGSHVDDIELGCGGTLQKMISQGHKVMYLALSWCGNPDLSKECQLSTSVLGEMDIQLFNFTVRRFSDDRQEILDTLIKIRDSFQPDIVFTHGAFDNHQDHQVVHQESIRAFKKQSLFGYNFPWNSIKTVNNFTVTIDVEKKLEALSKYESQKHREYFNPYFVMAMNFDGECFEVIRLNESMFFN